MAIWWLNFLLTVRWAEIPGSIHGRKKWIFLASLVVLSLLVTMSAYHGANRADCEDQDIGIDFRRESLVVAAVGGLGLLVCFGIWFPPATWLQIPFVDNWPARFQSTVDGLALLKRGVFVGWQWAFLGGYHSSSDLTVTLTVPAAIPMLLFGDRVGFHVAHLLLFTSVPLLIWLDLRIETDDYGHRASEPDRVGAALPWLAFGLVCATTAGFSYFLLRSGDTNSLAGVAATLVAIVGSQATARGRNWGPTMLVGGMAMVTYCHAGFFLYASVLLVAEAIYYRDARGLWRAVIAIVVGAIAGLPLTYESWRHPNLFIYNNVLYEPLQGIDWPKVARKIYYNVEILFLPGRWFNDFTGLTNVFIPVLLVMALGRRSRAGFYAVSALIVLCLLRLNAPEFGYGFLRPIHLLAVFVPPVIAAFLLRHAGDRLIASGVTLTVLLYLQVLARPVPHVDSLDAWQPALMERIRGLDGNLVLVENTYHRDMIAAEGQESENTPFGAHFQSLIPAATGKRLYAGIWDGWQWSPYRGHLVAGGAWRGKAIGDSPMESFITELRRWGIRHLLVVHEPTKRYLSTRVSAHPSTGAFVRHADVGRFAHFELANADTRSVTTITGRGELTAWDPLGGTVTLENVNAGDRVVVRTHTHPAWQARVASTGASIPVFSDGQQLAFDAPASGSYAVLLEYPARRWLLLIAAAATIAGVGGVEVAGGGRRRRCQHDEG